MPRCSYIPTNHVDNKTDQTIPLRSHHFENVISKTFSTGRVQSFQKTLSTTATLCLYTYDFLLHSFVFTLARNPVAEVQKRFWPLDSALINKLCCIFSTQGRKPTALYEAFIIFDILCGTASIWNMTAISVDR